MSNQEVFIKEIQEKYKHKGPSLVLGKGMLDGEVLPAAEVSIPLKNLNRHGLIAGATGTGKTKTLQVLAEQLSLQGVPSLMMDIKGDLSGLGAAGDASNKHVMDRHAKLDIEYVAKPFPVELMTISDEKGVKLKATVSEFGPVLLSKILELNDTQASIMSIIFKYCDDKKLPLIDLKDLRKVLQYISDTEQGKQEITQNYGSISPSSVGTILRKIVALEQQGADKFFGEPSFNVEDLLETDENGLGKINIVRLVDIQNQPNLFSTFMLSILAEIYSTFPEVGDAEKPKLVLFLDEAHLFFKEASKALLDQMENIIKLIRSKGVGVIFITQVPGDIPEEVLSQLGLKIQHALRGFTAKDRKEIEKAIENYPTTEFYKADELISNMATGEAFVSALNEKGVPTPLVHTYLRAPMTRMDVLADHEINEIVENSDLSKEYNIDIDKETAYEILSEKINKAVDNKELPPAGEEKIGTKGEKSIFSTILNSPLVRDVGRTFTRELTNSVLGILGIKRTRTRRR